jgi:nicotinamide riboside kinase
MKIAILGAECTGKTHLAQALVAQLQTEHPGTVWVSEYLREWCDAQQRTPEVHEQAPIAQVHMERIRAHGNATLLLCDTTPLMTAVYSDVLFGDQSLYPQALEDHRSFELTLVTGLDLPWVDDGFQRDGVVLRAHVNQRLCQVLQRHGIGYSSVYGTGHARTENALQAIRYALGLPRAGRARSNWSWPCEKCSDPQCEHRLFADLIQADLNP